MAAWGEQEDGSTARGRTWAIHEYLVALAALVGVAALISASFVRTSTAREAEAAVRKAGTYTADLAASEIQKDLDEVASSVGGVAATPNLGEVLTNAEGCSLTFSGQGLFPEGHLDVIAPDGVVACSSDPDTVRQAVSYANEDWFEQVTSRGEPLGPIIDESRERPVVVQAVPSDSGVVVAALLDLQAMGPELEVQFGGWRRFEFLVTSGDRIVARSIDPDRWLGTELTDAWPTAVNFERKDLDGVPRYYATAQLPRTGWTVHAGAGRAGTLAPAQRLFRDFTLIITLGGLLTFAALWIVWTRIARPIRALGRAVRDAESDPTSSVILARGPAEVVSLGADFDALLNSYEDRTKAVKESEARYRDMFERAVEGIAMTTLDGRILDANLAMATMLGYESPAELMQGIGSARDMYWDPDDRDRVIQAVARKRPVELEIPLRNKDGSMVLGSMNYIPILDENGAIESIQTRVIDITQRRELERQLAQSQRLESLGQLAGGIAHDFNNLLAVILNYSTFVKEALDTPSDMDGLSAARSDVEQIATAAERAASLTGQMLTFARMDVVRPQVLDPNTAVEEVEKLLSRTIGEDIDFVTSLAEDVSPIRIDRGQLEQVILNLAVNARDAMPDGGTLMVETSDIAVDEGYAATWVDLEVGRYVRLRVSDTGMGMDPEVAGKIFDPFFSTKPAGQGTGLGLATVHGIVAQAGGSIHVYTEPGVGTSISVLFPATDQEITIENPEEIRSLTGDETVLVVEDEQALREVMRRILTRHGYEVIVAANGSEAIAIAEEKFRGIDLVVADVVMPGMLGREVTERISELRPATKMIYMSGYAQKVLNSRGHLEPGTMLLEKPFSQTELLKAVRDALEGCKR